MANEVIAPTTATFAPGNTVIGFGSTLPAELAAWGPVDYPTAHPAVAIIMYNSEWNPAATVPTVKYTFITWVNVAGEESVAVMGYGLVENPSVSTTAVILAGQAALWYIDGDGNQRTAVGFQSGTNTPMLSVQTSTADRNAGAVAITDVGNNIKIAFGNQLWNGDHSELTAFAATYDQSLVETGLVPASLA